MWGCPASVICCLHGMGATVPVQIMGHASHTATAAQLGQTEPEGFAVMMDPSAIKAECVALVLLDESKVLDSCQAHLIHPCHTRPL